MTVEGLEPAVARHLAFHYGTEATAVARLMAGDPALAAPLIEGAPWRVGEVVYQARREMALTVSDVLIRRSHVFHLRADQGEDIAPLVAGLLQRELGWSDERRDASASAYLAEVERMRSALRRVSASR